ncbi:hypothetical protein GCM10023147_03630 [Tsukamurella soli]|uniref:Uncharacterized protein n=1 Tax=Tsukamurella soli TaxID=644556 RepID=A0ABP8J2J8_9ACTN
MDCVDAVLALSAAGVQLTGPVASMRDGSPYLAFCDAIMLADVQAIALPHTLVKGISVLFGNAFTRHAPDRLLAEAFERVQNRAAPAHVA